MWLIIFGCVFAGAFAAAIYLVTRFKKFFIVKKVCGDRKLLAWLLAAGFLIILSVALIFVFGLMNAIVCLLYLALFWLICDLIFFIIKKLRKKDFSKYYCGAAAIGLTVIYLGIGAYFAYHVSRTSYSIDTEKNVPKLRIVQIADVHMGTTFDAEKFSKYIERINAENPDLVVITGDFVDDGTSREDLFEGCRALSDLKTKYGVYFSYGNHDKGYYSESVRSWSAANLEEALTENGVTILEDEIVDIGNGYCIIGRCDKEEDRKSMEQLMADVDKDKFCIVLDHQPSDYDAQAAAGADLVLSGHTHGGQLIPITYVGEWIGVNCRTYGYEKRGGTNFIVTSGISAWAIKFKTGCKSEYVVIDIY